MKTNLRPGGGILSEDMGMGFENPRHHRASLFFAMFFAGLAAKSRAAKPSKSVKAAVNMSVVPI
jgi:hypothetical protein